MGVLIAATILAPWVFPQEASPCKCGDSCPCVRVERARCTDGTLIERTATGWRVVGTPNASEPTPNVSATTSGGCRMINGQMVCPQKR